MKILMLLLMVLNLMPLQAMGQAAFGTEGGGGGRDLEARVNQIRAQLLNWINAGGATEISFPSGISQEMYEAKMSMILQPKAANVVFVEKDHATDRELQVKVDGVPKDCRGFYSKKTKKPTILCNSIAFKALSFIEKYRLIHHEYAGLVSIEKNDGSVSDYEISNQLTAVEGALITEAPTITDIVSNLEKAANNVIKMYERDLQIGIRAIQRADSWEEYYSDKLMKDISIQNRWIYDEVSKQVNIIRRELTNFTSKLTPFDLEAILEDLAEGDFAAISERYVGNALSRAQFEKIISAVDDQNILGLENEIATAVRQYEGRVIYPKLRFRDVKINRVAKIHNAMLYELDGTYRRHLEKKPNEYRAFVEPHNWFKDINGEYVYGKHPHYGMDIVTIGSTLALMNGDDIVMSFQSPKDELEHRSFMTTTNTSNMTYLNKNSSFRLRAITFGKIPYGPIVQLYSFLQNASEECPLIVTIDTNQYLAAKFKFSCDPFGD